MRVLITGGGTAGHVNPALAIADAIARYEKDSVIEYVGTENGLEGKLVKKRGLKLHPLEVYG
ncbi:MAG: glycosyltransferase, partial [Clostridia bacterium]|nr:glycosyltransferase [Clostridia bacterium]